LKSAILNEFTKDIPKVRFQQGDILKDVSIIAGTDYDEVNHEIIVSETTLEYAVIINQDCDLEHDFTLKDDLNNHDKDLPNILLLPAYLSSKFKDGKHMGEKRKSMVWNSALFKPITQNNNNRFHFINSNEDYQIPDLVIDFKHVYSINKGVIYRNINQVYLASFCELYRESLSHRYSFFLSRIGLPDRES
jgi:hypothetical protein